MISVKPDLFRHPAVIALGGALLAALVAANVFAFMQGTDEPWLLGTVILTDIGVMVASFLGVLWSIAVWGGRSDASEARLDAIVDSAMDGIIAIDAAQMVVLFNRAAEQMFGVRRDQAIGSSLERFIPQRFRAAHHGHVDKFSHTGITSRRMGHQTTLWALRADGSEFPIEASISQAGQPGKRLFTVILRDITPRLQRDQALHRQQQELRELSARVLEAREEEKTLIARELHDELGQLLTALKMDLAWLRERGGADAAAPARLEAMGELLDRLVGSTRRIAANLRPLMLDDLGLADAAHWLVDDFASRSGMPCELQVTGEDAFAALDAKVATAVYRALQESLTNVAKHAGARHAWVTLRATGEELQFEVEDDGRGIDPADLDKARSLGLKGMRERVSYFGGTLDVSRAPRGGTRVRARIPVRAQEPA
ncbi:MAG: PAS domain-containing sensor histidine kinase [Betaproteobacteria bacterium]|nr:PAS domain-containing sensor histidine kinase [Betaproteobacteria bacterium]MDH5221844.1 PAS domain-containing sensor histidine kinase [Betaproteobacteria bacterium]